MSLLKKNRFSEQAQKVASLSERTVASALPFVDVSHDVEREGERIVRVRVGGAWYAPDGAEQLIYVGSGVYSIHESHDGVLLVPQPRAPGAEPSDSGKE